MMIHMQAQHQRAKRRVPSSTTNTIQPFHRHPTSWKEPSLRVTGRHRQLHQFVQDNVLPQLLSLPDHQLRLR